MELTDIYEQISKEMRTNPRFNDKNHIRAAYDLAHQIIRFNAIGISFEYTPSDALKFKIKLSDNEVLIITDPMHVSHRPYYIYSYFIGRQPIKGGEAQIETLVKAFSLQ